MIDNYEWYLAGYDFLVARWNEICRNEFCDLRELPRVLERVRLMMTDTWNRQQGVAFLMRVHYNFFMANPRFWCDKALIDADRIIVSAASDLRRGL